MRALLLTCAATLVFGCSSSSTPEAPGDGGTTGDDAAGPADAGPEAAPFVDAGPQDTKCAGPCPASAIKHVIIIVQENHTFDSHFGAYCKATPGSNPTCNDGPACCEAMPATDPAGVKPTVLNDVQHAKWDPSHLKACELSEIDDGKMDRFAAPGDGDVPCGDKQNVVAADPTIIKPYWDLAAKGALADRYFQPIVGQSSANDMYLARASFVFDDNAWGPMGAAGMTCDVEAPPKQYTETTIADLLNTASVPWAWFAGGYKTMVAAAGGCPTKPADCPFPLGFYPCAFDPSDVPFEYYPSTVDKPASMRDLDDFDAILSGTGDLPAVSFVKPIGYESEHPGTSVQLSPGVNRVASIFAAVASSRYRDDTLVILTYDEGGGYFDHVKPPPASTVDNEPYGTRIPFLAAGPFARTNYVSHVTMEHSSLVKFIEWNWLGKTTGQLGTRDAVVANIGSVLDPTKTGVAVPEN